MARFKLSSILLLIIAGFMLAGCSGHVREYEAELFFQHNSETGNSLLWHPERKSLFWVETDEKQLFEYTPATKQCNSWQFDSKAGCVVPETDDQVVLALEKRIIRYNLNKQEETLIATIDSRNKKLRCNDGKCSPNGRLWIGTVDHNYEKGRGAAYCVYPDGRVNEMFKGLTASNGLVWSSDKRFMFHNDLPSRLVKRYRYDLKSEDVIHNGVAVNIPKETGVPEGIRIDRHDNLWIPQREGFGVYCYNPYTGQLLAKVSVPSPNVMSCVFGGENMDTLFIITTRKGLTEQELASYPLSGSIFACKIAPIGLKPFYFGRQEN